MPRDKILIATTNPAKKKYLEFVVEDLNFDFDIVYLEQLDKEIDIEEIGKNFKENAELKAAQYSTLVDHLAICSDGGLIIPALGDKWDSLLTHRFAGAGATDLDRVNALLKLIQRYKGKQRVAYFQEAIAIGKQGRSLFSYETKSSPRQLSYSFNPKKFIKGFWIANLLYYPEIEKYHADLSERQRLEISSGHWQEFKKKVEEFLKKNLLK